MIPKRHPNTTHWLGAPKDWKPEEHGTCGHLAIAAVAHPAGVAMLSRWEPTPAELAMLNAGGSIELSIVGNAHPPVSLIAVPPLEAEPEVENA